jgi:predicted site-specific integrase-resolvase
MEVLTAAKKKELRMLGMLDGLRLARTAIADADRLPKEGLKTCSEIIDHEISKIMTLPEHRFD